MKSVAILLSGGVDSSVALLKLKEQGFKIRAFYLKIWLEDELSYLGNCPWEEDIDYIQKTCKLLNIDFEIIPMQREYWSSVVNYMIESIKNGLTPNPDMLCNRNIKLGSFLNLYEDNFDYIATGHYAKRIEINKKIYLGMTNDVIKDQTYFLAYTKYNAIKKTLFPIGDLIKNDVRKIAIQNNLPTADRPDSQGICFLGKIKINEFLKHHLGEKIGNIICFNTGKILAKHNGYWFYTIGQRQGIGLSGGPWYVIKKDFKENIIYVSKKDYKINKNEDEFFVDHINWLIDEEDIKINIKNNIFVKLRHGPQIYNIKILQDDINNNFTKIKIKLDEKDHGIALGQFCVFYNENKICLGAGEMNFDN